MAFRTGPMPHGGTYEEFAELLARFHLTFAPLKARGGDDARDAARIAESLVRFARRYDVPVPAAVAKEDPHVEAFRTPGEAMDGLSAFIAEHGLCQEGVAHAQHDAGDRDAIGQAVLGIFHRHKALVAKFDTEHGGIVAVGIERWMAGAERAPMARILDPARKEA